MDLLHVLAVAGTILVGTYAFLMTWVFRSLNGNRERIVALEAKDGAQKENLNARFSAIAQQCSYCIQQTNSSLAELKSSVAAVHRRIDEMGEERAQVRDLLVSVSQRGDQIMATLARMKHGG